MTDTTVQACTYVDGHVAQGCTQSIPSCYSNIEHLPNTEQSLLTMLSHHLYLKARSFAFGPALTESVSDSVKKNHNTLRATWGQVLPM